MEKVIPEWVFEDQSGYKMFQPEGFEGLIVEAIKEQQQIIDIQQSQIITQQQEINKLKELVEELLYSDK